MVVPGSILLTLGVLTVVGGAVLLFAPFLIVGILLVVAGLFELRRAKGL